MLLSDHEQLKTKHHKPKFLENMELCVTCISNFETYNLSG